MQQLPKRSRRRGSILNILVALLSLGIFYNFHLFWARTQSEQPPALLYHVSSTKPLPNTINAMETFEDEETITKLYSQWDKTGFASGTFSAKSQLNGIGVDISTNSVPPILHYKPSAVISLPIYRGDCRPRKLSAPSKSDSNPHIYDVFAGDDFKNVYFITQRYFGKCAPEDPLDRQTHRNFMDSVFICKFSAPSDPLQSHYVYSKRTLKRDVYDSTLTIRCPIPESLEQFANNKGPLGDLNVTLIPTHYLEPEKLLKPIENVPVCGNPIVNDDVVLLEKKRNYLSACVWLTGDAYYRVDDASLKHSNVSDALLRFKEWLLFHRMVGFDHFYVYDNSKQRHGALWNMLKPFVDKGVATYIHWPARVCARHRASQYAAENSCLRRFGPLNTWMAHFDVDEYMTPTGTYKSLVPLLQAYERNASVDAVGLNDHFYGLCPGESTEHDESKLFLEERSCFTGKKVHFKRKEIVKPEKVYYHWIHYSQSREDGSRPSWIMLDGEREAKLTHTRAGTIAKEGPAKDDPVVLYWIPKLKKQASEIY